MALIPTHIRFALDVQSQFPIQDLTPYISGTVYPDSRWLTGMDREQTHSGRFTAKDFPRDDFTCGWHVHCVCDFIQNRIHSRIFRDMAFRDAQDQWVWFSVAKVIQDMNDLRSFDLQAMLHHLDHVENPNGEDLERLKRFYRIIQATYRDHPVPTPSDYRSLWIQAGLEIPVADRLKNRLESALNDRELVSRIESIYTQMLAAFPTFSL